MDNANVERRKMHFSKLPLVILMVGIMGTIIIGIVWQMALHHAETQTAQTTPAPEGRGPKPEPRKPNTLPEEVTPQRRSARPPQAQPQNGGLTEAELRWMRQLTGPINAVEEEWTTMTVLLKTADPSDPRWMSAFHTNITNLREAYQEMKTVSAPTKYRGVQAEINEGATLMLEGLDLLERGVDTRDADMLNAASAKFEEGSKHIVSAQDKLKTISNQSEKN